MHAPKRQGLSISVAERLPMAIVLASLVAAAGCATAPPTMTMEAVVSPDAPKAIGPYSQGIRVGNLLFLSGQGPIDAKTNVSNNGTIEEQTKVVLDNLSAVLAANGMTTRNVVNTTVYLKDINDFAKMNAVYATYFKDNPPARATVQVAAIPRGALVEISAVASR